MKRKEIIEEGIRFSKSKNGDDGGQEWKMKRFLNEKGEKYIEKEREWK